MRNNDHVVTMKIEKTFSYRRQEALRGQPLVADFKSRWPALFTEKEDDKIHTRRACVLKSLCIYLNEDHEKLVRKYLSTDTKAIASMEQTVLGVYVIQKEGAVPGDDPEDISVLIEVVEVLSHLDNIGTACVLLFGLIYCLNLSYPPDLRCPFEVLQKILLNLDRQRLSSKV